MQGTLIRSLVWEDPTCCGATKPEHHNYWACGNLQLLKPVPLRVCAPQQEKPPQWEAHAPQLQSGPHSLQLENAPMQQRRLSTDNKERNTFKINEKNKSVILISFPLANIALGWSLKCKWNFWVELSENILLSHGKISDSAGKTLCLSLSS